jgi:uncharacterized membrane protein HdeD (DUF308 family)
VCKRLATLSKREADLIHDPECSKESQMALADITPPLQPFERTWKWTLVLGAALAVLGGYAIAQSRPSSESAVLVLGWFLLVGGILETLQSLVLVFCWKRFAFALLSGFVAILAGLLLLTGVIAGAVLCTLTVALFFIADGVCQVAFGTTARAMGTRWAIFEGAFTLSLGFYVLYLWPYYSTWLLGIALGTTFALRGWSYVVLAFNIRHRTLTHS